MAVSDFPLGELKGQLGYGFGETRTWHRIPDTHANQRTSSRSMAQPVASFL